MTDKDIINEFWININGKETFRGQVFNRRINKVKEEPFYSYLKNRYSDSLSLLESIKRIYYSIEYRPVCKTCGKEVKFVNLRNKIFNEYCCRSCEVKNKDVITKHKQTCLVRYGEENYTNREKFVNTCNEKYGSNSPFGNKDIIEKSNITKLIRYGNIYFTNPLKRSLTKEKKYGVKGYCNPEKTKQTKLIKYGDANFNNKEKYKETCLSRYGVKNAGGIEESIKKIKETKQLRYNDSSYNNHDKIVDTTQQRYGVSYLLPNNMEYSKEKWIENAIKIFPNRIEEIKNNDAYYARHLLEQHTKVIHYGDPNFNNPIKRYNTMKENGSFKCSMEENYAYLYLSLNYPDTVRQYKDEERYPFNCDFYVPSLDLFIECNFHWTHQGHIYDPNSIEDQKLLYELQHKNGKYYDNAGKTWTIRDPLKYNTAKQNNLNYKIFWNLNELIKWLE